MLKGIEYDDGESKLNNIIDPTLLFTLVRNVFETLCAFELVNIIPDTDNKKQSCIICINCPDLTIGNVLMILQLHLRCRKYMLKKRLKSMKV